MKDPPFIGQVIIEKPFKSREAAERWMATYEKTWCSSDIHIESHLWETPGKEVKK